jgi:hypothetical protein
MRPLDKIAYTPTPVTAPAKKMPTKAKTPMNTFRAWLMSA